MNAPASPTSIGGIRYLNIVGTPDLGYLSKATDDKDDAKLPDIFELKYE